MKKPLKRRENMYKKINKQTINYIKETPPPPNPKKE
jgi:hypothetical protein